MKHYDFIVIGTGGAGNTAAFRLASAGKVLICDDKQFGGTCAISGCDPKKVMMAAAEFYDFGVRMADKEVAGTPAKPSWSAMMRHKREFTTGHTEKLIHRYNKAGIDTAVGRASFTGEHSVRVGGEEFSFGKALIASGSKPFPLPFPGSEHLCTNECFLDLDELPERVLFIGGGYISVEFANIAHAFGADVVIVQMDSRLVPGFEADIAEVMTESIKDKGMCVFTGAAVRSVEKTSAGKFKVMIDVGGKVISEVADLVVHGAGRVPNLDGLEPEKANIDYSRRGIKVSEYLQTANPDIYAGGDCTDTDGLMLSPVAFMEGYIAAENILKGNIKKPDYSDTGTVMFNVPALAAVGLTEQQAKERGLDFRTRFKRTEHWFTSFRLMEKFSAYKVIIENKTDKILGAHMIGPHAEDIINLFTLAMRQGSTIHDLRKVLYAYPTASSDILHMIG